MYEYQSAKLLFCLSLISSVIDIMVIYDIKIFR